MIRLALFICGLLLVVGGTVGLIEQLHATQVQLDSAFMQGMEAGGHLCRGGV